MLRNIITFVLLVSLIGCQSTDTSQPANPTPSPSLPVNESSLGSSPTPQLTVADTRESTQVPSTATSRTIPPLVNTATVVEVSGLIATVPTYATLSVEKVADLAGAAYPGVLPKSIQLLVLLTKEDEAFLVLALDIVIDSFVTAGTVAGVRIPLPEGLPSELDFVGGLIVSDKVTLMEPELVVPKEVNEAPAKYAFKRVRMDTGYLFSGGRIKDAPPSLDHLGFGLATDHLASQDESDHLVVVDPYNTETQIRQAELIGTVLYPTVGMRSLFSKVLRFGPEDLGQVFDRPSVFYEELEDDEAQLLSIGDLISNLRDYDGELVSVEGLAAAGNLRTEDIKQLANLPLHFTFKAIGVADLTGAMPVVGISSQDVRGGVVGPFRFVLSIYTLGEDVTLPFLISKEPVILDFVLPPDLGNQLPNTPPSYSP